MFKGLRLRNFRCYADSQIVPLAPLTVIIGANNSGKSTLLNAILLLKQSYDDRGGAEPFATTGPLVDLGGFYDIMRGGATAPVRPVEVTLQLDPKYVDEFTAPDTFEPPELARRLPPFATELTVNFTFDKSLNGIRLVRSVYSRNGANVLTVRSAGRRATSIDIPPKLRTYLHAEFSRFLPTLNLARRPPSSSALRRKALDLALHSSVLAHMWSHAFGEIEFMSPNREPVPRYGSIGATSSEDSGHGGQNLLRILGESLKARSQRRVVDEVSEWLVHRFELLRTLKLVSIDKQGTVKSLFADDPAGFKDLNVANMGRGVSELLPIVAAATTLRNYGILLVEQPEVHLHPAAQADLGDLFVEAVAGKDSKQVIVETHSEHMLLRIRRRIAKGDIDPEKVCVLFVERGAKQSTVHAVEVQRNGQAKWPRAFFETGYLESMALARESAQTK